MPRALAFVIGIDPRDGFPVFGRPWSGNDGVAGPPGFEIGTSPRTQLSGFFSGGFPGLRFPKG